MESMIFTLIGRYIVLIYGTWFLFRVCRPNKWILPYCDISWILVPPQLVYKKPGMHNRRYKVRITDKKGGIFKHIHNCRKNTYTRCSSRCSALSRMKECIHSRSSTCKTRFLPLPSTSSSFICASSLLSHTRRFVALSSAMYSVAKPKASSTSYPDAIQPSGRARLRTCPSNS